MTGRCHWEHPTANPSSEPLVAGEDRVAARQVWPLLGCAWERAVSACGGFRCVRSDSGERGWEPPAGSQLHRFDGASVADVGTAHLVSLHRARGRLVAPPPRRLRVGLVTSPVIEGERELRWLGQWDAVAREHVLCAALHARCAEARGSARRL